MLEAKGLTPPRACSTMPGLRDFTGFPTVEVHIMAQAQTLAAPPARPKVRQTRLLINNKWVDAVEGGRFETYDPATGEVIAQVAAGTAADVDKAVKAARRALEKGP